MFRSLIACLALAASLSATPATAPPKATTFKATQGTVSRTLTVNPPCLKCTATDTTQNGVRKFSGGSLGGQMLQFNEADGFVTTGWIYQPATCPPVHPPESRTENCADTNPGTTGTWQQTRTYTQSPAPGCVDTPGQWLPTAAPAGACTGSSGGGNLPPEGNFHFVVTGNSVAFTGSTHDPEGWIISWSWNFGDGGTSTAQNPTHAYANAGTYSVSETITDNDGATTTTSQPVTIGTVTPGCNAPPVDAQTDTACQNGNGTFHQTHGWTQGAPPACTLTALPWTPATPGPTDCQPAPPAGPLAFNVTADQSSAAFLRYQTIVNSHDPNDVSATDASWMFQFTGGTQYAQQCISLADAIATSAEADIAAGRVPAIIAGDSYLGSGDRVQSLAVAFAWCNPSTSQKARYKALIEQTVFNIWNPTLAKWGTFAAPWNGWATDDPFNNYFYSFSRATMMDALAVGSNAIVRNGQNALAFVRGFILPKLATAYATMPGGGSLEGDGYGTSHMGLFELYKWWKDSTGEDITNAHMTNSIEFWAHATIPEMAHFWPIGSQTRDSTASMFDYQIKLVVLACAQTAGTSARNTCNWWLSHIRGSDGSPYSRMARNFMVFWDFLRTSATGQPPLLTYAAPEMGAYMGRTSWTDPNACWAGTLMGQYSQSHAHPEQGSVQFACRGGWLVAPNNMNSRSGIHGEDHNGEDKNTVRFFKGGAEQKQGFGNTQVLSYTPNPNNGDYRVVGEMSSLFSSGAGVNSWKRDVAFTAGGLLVTDSVSLAVGTTAMVQWNVPVQPTIVGNIVTAGHLKITAPAGAVVTKTDMRTVDPDYQSGWRVQYPVTASAQTRLEATP